MNHSGTQTIQTIDTHTHTHKSVHENPNTVCSGAFTHNVTQVWFTYHVQLCTCVCTCMDKHTPYMCIHVWKDIHVHVLYMYGHTSCICTLYMYMYTGSHATKSMLTLHLFCDSSDYHHFLNVHRYMHMYIHVHFAKLGCLQTTYMYHYTCTCM